MENWKDIPGYETSYQISDQGRVKNKNTGKILHGDTNSAGYQRVFLNSQTKKKRFFVHRLVARVFCDGYQENLVVNHIDGNKQNNFAVNLEWVTRSQNDLHAYRYHLRDVYPCIFKHKIEAVDPKTGEVQHVYENVQECCDALRVARSNVYNCCNGKQQTCKGFSLRYI